MFRKRLTAVLFAAACLVPASALADIDDYLSNPGRQQATAVGAQCGSGAGSGAFGFFGGRDNNLRGGADGRQTGINNSSVCGNRDSAPGQQSLLSLVFGFFVGLF